jgi:hypothetical protein
MITHITLYGFPSGFDEIRLNEFNKALRGAAAECATSQSFALARHIRLPIDDPHVPASGLHSIIARWDFNSVDALRAFSEHPKIRGFVRQYVRPAGGRVAFINYDCLK